MNDCCMGRDRLLAWAKSEYGAEPEYLWRRYPRHAVLRHAGNRKWFALVADVDRVKHDIEGEGRVDFLVIKEDPGLISEMLKRDGFYPAYHMDKTNWISVALDGSVPDDEIRSLVAASYMLTDNR